MEGGAERGDIPSGLELTWDDLISNQDLELKFFVLVLKLWPIVSTVSLNSANLVYVASLNYVPLQVTLTFRTSWR